MNVSAHFGRTLRGKRDSRLDRLLHGRTERGECGAGHGLGVRGGRLCPAVVCHRPADPRERASTRWTVSSEIEPGSISRRHRRVVMVCFGRPASGEAMVEGKSRLLKVGGWARLLVPSSGSSPRRDSSIIMEMARCARDRAAVGSSGRWPHDSRATYLAPDGGGPRPDRLPGRRHGLALAASPTGAVAGSRSTSRRSSPSTTATPRRSRAWRPALDRRGHGAAAVRVNGKMALERPRNFKLELSSFGDQEGRHRVECGGILVLDRQQGATVHLLVPV